VARKATVERDKRKGTGRSEGTKKLEGRAPVNKQAKIKADRGM
jgi:hypothetical protein